MTAPVVVEWWRGQRGPVARLLESFAVEPLDDELAHVAGMALSHASKGPSVTDAVVMAAAALRRDIVLTGDIEDLTLQSVFPANFPLPGPCPTNPGSAESLPAANAAWDPLV